MRCLELFSGTKSLSKVFENAGWECISVDIDSSTNPTICCSILEIALDKWPPGYFEYIHASPPCSAWSIARTTGPPINYETESQISLHTVNLINHLRPLAYTIENPHTSRIWKLPWLQDLPYVVASYCKYSNYGYRKDTRFATNLDWIPKRCKYDCMHVTRSSCGRLKHICTAQRGKASSTDTTYKQKELYRIPAALCLEILEAVLRKTATVGN